MVMQASPASSADSGAMQIGMPSTVPVARAGVTGVVFPTCKPLGYAQIDAQVIFTSARTCQPPRFDEQMAAYLPERSDGEI